HGWLVEHGNINTTPYTLPVPATSGVYIVYVYSGGQTYQRKIIVP
ncbi:MAG TPA: hypothetical protein DEQ84_02195, partial [Prevotellaceae bacterium]|nr:hypothetical protein [Prevotellaceae bacterium]